MFRTPMKPPHLFFLPLCLLSVITATGADRYWNNSAADSNWVTPANWSADALGSGPTGAPGALDDVYFNVNSLTAAQTVSLNSAPSLNTLNFTGTSGGVILRGGGANRVLTLAGGINVAAGAGAVTIGGGTNQNVTIVASGSLTWTNNSSNLLTIQNGVSTSSAVGETLSVGGSGNTSFLASITNGSGGGTLALTKTGLGTVTTVSSTRTGITTINGGTLATASLANGGSNSGLGASSSASANLVFDGGTLQWTGGTATGIDRGFTLNAGGGTIRNNNADPAILIRFGGNVTGAGGLTKVGSGTLALSGAASDYAGKTLVNEGTLSVRQTASLGATGTVANGTEVAAGAILELHPGTTGGPGSGTQTWTEVLTLAGGTLHNASLNNNWTGGIILTANSILSSISSTLNVNSVISDGGGGFGFTKTGGSTVSLGTANTFTGVVRVSEGTLTLANFSNGGLASSLGQSSSASSNLILDGGTLALNNNFGADRGATFAAGKTSGISVGGSASNNFRFSGIMTGSGTINKTGIGILAFSNTQNDYTGVINVNQGTLSVRRGSGTGGLSTLGTSTGASDGTVVNAGGTLQFDPGNSTEGAGTNISMAEHITLNGGTLRGHTLSSTVTGAVVLTQNSSLTAASGASLTISSATALTESGGSFGITKGDAGTVVIQSTTNNYTGATTVTGGTLSVTGNINSSTALNVSGGTFAAGASGIINDAAAVNLSGGVLQMNGFTEAMGVLAVTGSAELALGGGNSVITFSDAAADWTGAALSVTGWTGLATGGGSERVLFTSTGALVSHLGTITFVDPLGFAAGTYSAKLIGNELVPDALIPEPTTWLLAMLSGLGFVIRRRR